MRTDRRRSCRRRRLFGGSLLVCAALLVPAAAQEARLLSEQSEGLVEVSGQTRLELLDLQGKLTVRAGRAGELRFMCRAREKRDETRPVALWLDGSTLFLMPVADAPAAAVLLEVTVPPGMSVRFETRDSQLAALNLDGDLEVKGERLQFQGRSLRGGVSLEVEEGAIDLQGADAEVELEGRGLDAALTKVAGAVDMSVTDSEVRLADLRDELRVDGTRSRVTVNVAQGRIEADLTGGALVAMDLRRGGEFRLSEAALSLDGSRGTMEVETDSQVEVRGLDGNLRLRGDRGSLTGSTIGGGVDLDLREMTVELQDVQGGVRIGGDQLELRLRDLKGEVSLVTRSSQIEVDGAEGLLSIDNEWGDVTVARAQQSVQIDNRQGSVRVAELSGALQLRADGPEVTVQWTQVNPDQDSFVENRSGDVRLQFSANGGGRLQAEARGGRVESSLDGVQVSDDETTAVGMVNGISRPTIQVISGGSLYLDAARPGP